MPSCSAPRSAKRSMATEQGVSGRGLEKGLVSGRPGWVSERTRPLPTSPTHMSVQVRVEKHQGTGERVNPI